MADQRARDSFETRCEPVVDSCDFLLGQFLALRDAGVAPDVEEFLQAHPRHAAELREYLAADGMLGAVLDGEEPVSCEDGDAGMAEHAEAVAGKRFRLRVDGDATLGDLQLLRPLGAGGMGEVYLARQAGLDRDVVVKVISQRRLGRPTASARFENEARLAARLQHPNIVAVHGVGRADDLAYFTMDFVDGVNLQEQVFNEAPSSEQVATWMLKIARAIEYAHQQDVLHRDLKPANLLIERGSLEPFVVDFGLARCLESDDQLTAPGETVGTLEYVAPDQLEGHKLTPSVDIYGLGGVLYFLLTGSPPRRGQFPGEKIREAITRDPVAPRLIDQTVPKDLETICLKCLDRNPKHRYASAGAIADELERFLDNRPIQARPLGFLSRAVRWSQRQPALAALVLVAGLLAIGGPIVALRMSALWRQSEAARSEAAAANRDTQDFADFFSGMFQEGSPSASGRDTKVVDVITAGAEAARRDFADRPRLLAKILTATGTTSDGLNWSEAALADLEQAAQINAREYGEQAPETLLVKAQLGNALRQAGRYDDAIHLLQDVRTMWEAVLPTDVEDYFSIVQTLAIAFQGDSRYANAANWHEVARAGFERLHGPSHVVTLSAMQQEGWTRMLAGEYEHARDLLEPAVAGLAEQAPESPDFIYARTALGSTYRGLGDSKHAVDLHRAALADAERILGEGHVDTLHSMNSLAISLMHLSSQRAYRDLKPEIPALIETRFRRAIRYLGEGHPVTLHAKADYLRECVDTDAKLVQYPVLIDQMQATLGSDHQFTTATMVNVAGFYTDAGEYAIAASYFEQALPLTIAIFGEVHKKTDKCKRLFADCLAATGDYSRAAKLQADAAEIRAAIYGDNAFQTRRSLFKSLLYSYAAGEHESFVSRVKEYVGEESQPWDLDTTQRCLELEAHVAHFFIAQADAGNATSAIKRCLSITAATQFELAEWLVDYVDALKVAAAQLDSESRTMPRTPTVANVPDRLARSRPWMVRLPR